MRRSAGFTLIEMAVVLAIIAVVAGVLTPTVTGYIDQARTTRADVDVSKIGQSILMYRRDTGFYPIFDTLASARAGTGAKPCMSSGATGGLPAGPNHSSWVTLCTTSAPLDRYLNINTLGITTSKSADVGIAYRGPYLSGLDGHDPWGNPYLITSAYLANETDWAFAASAGPSGGLETNASQIRSASVLTTTGDDIISLIH